MSVARRQLHKLQRWLPASEAGVLILGYHLVGAGTDAVVDIPSAIFRRQLSELAARARIVSLGQALELLERGDGGSDPIVVLTFDDAYENFYADVFPLLHEMSLPATLYVPVGFIEGAAPAPIRGTEQLPACSWEQLREMLATGLVTVGSHTCGHPNLKRLGQRAAEAELRDSRQILKERLGLAADSFCYPKSLWSRRLEALVAKYYRTAMVGGGRKNTPRRWSPLRLSRVPIRRDMDASLLPLLSAPVWLEEWVANWARGHV